MRPPALQPSSKEGYITAERLPPYARQAWRRPPQKTPLSFGCAYADAGRVQRAMVPNIVRSTHFMSESRTGRLSATLRSSAPVLLGPSSLWRTHTLLLLFRLCTDPSCQSTRRSIAWIRGRIGICFSCFFVFLETEMSGYYVPDQSYLSCMEPMVSGCKNLRSTLVYDSCLQKHVCYGVIDSEYPVRQGKGGSGCRDRERSGCVGQVHRRAST